MVLLIGFLVVSLAPALRMGLNASGADTTLAQCAASCTYTVEAGGEEAWGGGVGRAGHWGLGRRRGEQGTAQTPGAAAI